jgi:hypothetical protein
MRGRRRECDSDSEGQSGFVTTADHGAGVVELIEKMIVEDDLASLNSKLKRHGILLGDADGDCREFFRRAAV